MRHAYVYYRVDPVAAPRAAAGVDALFATLSAYCNMPPRRLMRCDDATTWMEVYEGIADWPGFSAAMAEHLRTSPLAPLIDGERHVEWFCAAEH